MVLDMTEKELISVTIDNYMNLQRIKKANGDNENTMAANDCALRKQSYGSQRLYASQTVLW